jgi:nucleotide-binding universal stress UspA family protein
MTVTVITWVVEGTWAACVDATRRLAPDNADIVLLHVTGGDISAAAHGAYVGLLGRGPRRDRDPGPRLAELGAASAAELLEAAARALGRPCTTMERRGRVEREVVAAAEDADLLVLARDGDDARLGPKSLGPASRFVVDHAPCPVLLVWPRETPGTGSIPHSPYPPHPPHPLGPGSSR